MQRILFLLMAMPLVILAADGETRTACEEEAFKYFPDPNFNPQRTGRGSMGGPAGGADFTTSVPSASDYEKARQQREKYIEECRGEKTGSEQ